MTFRIRKESRPNRFGVDDRVLILDDGQGNFVEIAPSLGFNCYRWHSAGQEILYTAPDYFEDNRPTRSGFPILFPFPNRIRDGHFVWEGKEYQLPKNDPAAKNAIHGFACRHPWRLIDQGTNDKNVWLTGEFQGSKDAPQTLELWPADYKVTLTYRFQGRWLSIVAEVANPDTRPLPWGLGYHPYFTTGPYGGDDAQVLIRANKYWELVDSLPTGKQFLLDDRRNCREARRFGDLQLDDVFTDLHASRGEGDLELQGWIGDGQRLLKLYCSRLFNQMVVFTPPHRQAICLEPYTCVTDAIHLQQQNIEPGWQVLAPGQSVTSTVFLKLEF